ncbi:MAG: ribonuclease III [Candidatus Aenigmatarchaeota archaeon]
MAYWEQFMKNTFKKLPKLNLNKLEKIIGSKINTEEVWLTALTHKSWLFLNPDYKLNHNERLEFLGDAILEMLVSLYLYVNFPNLSEGDMSLVRSNLINREKLAEIAKKLGIDKFVLMAKNLDEKGIKTILSDTLEAIIGAMFLDLGFEKTKNFVEKYIVKNAKKIVEEKKFKDPKTILQEIVQKEYKFLPEYKIIESWGPPHKKKFKIGVYLKGKKIAEGEGTSKKEAELDAALKALKVI